MSKEKQPYATKWRTPEGDMFQIVETTAFTAIMFDARVPSFGVSHTINGKELWHTEEELVEVFQNAAEAMGFEPVKDTVKPRLDKQTKQQLRDDILAKLPNAFPGCPQCGSAISTVDTDHRKIIQWSCGSWMYHTTFHQTGKCKDSVRNERQASE